MTKASLVLEGGATRGVFTSGALDYLMEKMCTCHMRLGYLPDPAMESIMSRNR